MQNFYTAAIIQASGDGPDDGYDVIFQDFLGCTSSGRYDGAGRQKRGLELFQND